MSFFHSIFRWFCHFDDDNYVNLPALIRTLKEYDPKEDWYLGKTSIQTPLEVINRGTLSSVSFIFQYSIYFQAQLYIEFEFVGSYIQIHS